MLPNNLGNKKNKKQISLVKLMKNIINEFDVKN